MFKCSICPSVVSRKDTLVRHMEIHNGRAHICDVCHRKFTYKCNLKKHMENVHKKTKIQRHKKDLVKVEAEISVPNIPASPSVVSRKDTLVRHMDIHNGRTYICDVCHRKFSYKCNLKKHMENIHKKTKVQRYEKDLEKVEAEISVPNIPASSSGKTKAQRYEKDLEKVEAEISVPNIPASSSGELVTTKTVNELTPKTRGDNMILDTTKTSSPNLSLINKKSSIPCGTSITELFSTCFEGVEANVKEASVDSNVIHQSSDTTNILGQRANMENIEMRKKAFNVLKNVYEGHRDEFTLLGEEVAMRVRELREPYARSLVKLKIQTLLYEASVGYYDEASDFHYSQSQPQTYPETENTLQPSHIMMHQNRDSDLSFIDETNSTFQDSSSRLITFN